MTLRRSLAIVGATALTSVLSLGGGWSTDHSSIPADEIEDGTIHGVTSRIAGDTLELAATQNPSEAQHADGSVGSASGGDTAGSSAVIPVGAAPVVEQSAWPDVRNELRECPFDATALSVEFSCWDEEAQEAYWVWPAGEDEEDDGVEEEEAEAPVVTGAQLATAVREFARVRIAPAPLVIQPDQEWQLVNLPVIVRTEPAVQDFSTMLLGLPVDIRAEPVSYSWDFGDGSAVVNTTDPGAPYPEQTIEHAYEVAGEYQITLVTYWSGAFRVAGGPWIGIDGLGVTATTSPVLDLQTRTTRLVG